MFLHADGFDHYGINTGGNTVALLQSDNYQVASHGAGNPNIINTYTSGVTTVPPYGLGMLQFNAYQGGLKRTITSTNPQSTQFRMNWAAGLPIQEGWGLGFMLGDGSETEFIKIFFRTNGSMTISTSANFANTGNFLGTSDPNIIRSQVWQHWQFVWIPNTNGIPPYNAQCYIYLEGNLKLQVINININSAMGFHFLGQNGVVGNGPAVCIKDWIIADTANGTVIPTPPLQTDIRVPNGNGANTAWSANGAATQWQAVNNLTAQTAIYAYTTAVNQLQDFTLPVSSAPISNVFSVLAKCYAAKNGAGAGTIRIGLNSGATTGESADIPLANGFAFYNQFFDKDPNTNANWLSAAYNALGCRLNRTA